MSETLITTDRAGVDVSGCFDMATMGVGCSFLRCNIGLTDIASASHLFILKISRGLVPAPSVSRYHG